MRFRTRVAAQTATLTVFFSGLAMLITGVILVRAHPAIGGVLLAVGVPSAAFAPSWITGPDADPSAPRGPDAPK